MDLHSTQLLPSHPALPASLAKKIKAFTLVELSIVIVIIGLVVAGVTAGKSLVKSARLRNIITTAQSYNTAITTFKLQYNALPGDISNASALWGTNCDATPTNCNGNNNRKILFSSGVTNESWRAWQHLSLAKLILGTYTGTGTLEASEIGINTPPSTFPNVGYYLRNGDPLVTIAASGVQAIFTGNFIGIGGYRSGNLNNTQFFLPADAASLDTKSDDGIYNKGYIRGAGGYDGVTPHSPNCISGSSWNISYTGIACELGFRID